ncbi:unnamed protein product [Rotaria socialis]|uniref:carnitine O-palmitoyltransferase n=1 Tax=Rotaria socialis TaxID=392032 RepID=A0A817MJW9_9BILA|nr:unnamed protein product [Rotaria socialis]
MTEKQKGDNVDSCNDIVKNSYYSYIRCCQLTSYRTLNSLYNSLYPGHPIRGVIFCSTIPVLYLKGYDSSFGIITWLEEHIFRRVFPSKNGTLIACVTFAAGAYISIIKIRQYTLKALFSYHGWMYQKHGEAVGLIPKFWMGLVKVFAGRDPSLYSCQNILPALPLPSLDDTLQRYLRTVRPLYDDEAYQRTVEQADIFKNTIGYKLQRYLWFKWLLSSNYVTDWWEKFVYLRGRSPLIVNSNYYCLDAVFSRPAMKQTARAANIVYAALKYRTELELEKVKPLMAFSSIPLCSIQHERQFNTVRIPGKETDHIVHYSDSQHIAVYHKDRWYKVFTYYRNKLLQPCELQIQFDEILRDETPPADGEEHLAALTAGDRTLWATARETFFNIGCNRVSLDAIEKAAFVLILEDSDFEIGTNMSNEFDEYARAIFHGKGYDRWFDKSFNLIISKNAVFGLNVEHSWADAPVSGHMTEYVLAEDFIVLGYDPLGNTHGIPRFNAIHPIKLKWDLTSACKKVIEQSLNEATALCNDVQCKKVIEQSLNEATALCNDVDLHVYVQNSYSKNFIKKCKISPDAYIQMALQLAHYRDSGRFNLTYEASMTRLFRNSRTETVRSCSIESSAWIRAMENSMITNTERIQLLRLACDFHQQQYRDAMSGKGIDRHLFCLYVISKYLKLDSPFLQNVLQEPWKLSTSQTPTQYGNPHVKSNTTADGVSAGGGFGSVDQNGYGVSYIISEDIIFFHISSRRSSRETDSQRFGREIRKALDDIRTLFEETTKIA